MSRDAREHRKVIIEPLWATDENKTENRWVRKKKTEKGLKRIIARSPHAHHHAHPSPFTFFHLQKI